MKKTFFLILILVSLVTLGIRIFTSPLYNLIGFQEKAGIKILSNPAEAQVFLDELLVGHTPYENKELIPREYKLKLQSDKLLWEGKVKLNSGTLTLIGRDLSEDSLSSAGEILGLEKGSGVTVLSYPAGARVEIDGKSMGKTPLLANDLEIGEYVFTVSLDGFLTRSVRAVLHEDFNLIVNVDLAATEKAPSQPQLQIKTSPRVLVLQTSTGFLRVREKPSLASSEIARVAPGDELELLEELPEWNKVRLPNGKEGYVSSAFIQKKF